jgi:ATP-dependent Clp protease ATP-binding subunit ClpA
MSNTNVTLINGWITPRLEQVLRRAAEISTSHGHNYLAVEHLALVMIEDPNSASSRVWQGAMTSTEWHQALLGALPDAAANPGTPSEPVHIVGPDRRLTGNV